MTVLRLGGIIGLLTICAFYPFLPGEYDGLAVPLSLVAQVLGLAGLLFVPIGALWLAHEARNKGSRKPLHQQRTRNYALAAVAGCVIVALIASVVAWASSGRAFGCGMLALSAYVLFRLKKRFKASTGADPRDVGSTPLYLTTVPVVAFLLQVLLASPMTEFSRGRGIANGAELVGGLEKYHAAHGQYPKSLSGVWPDYKVSVVGIQQFHYTPYGDGYNLYFEQPLPLLDAPGTREFVVYNSRGQHLMLSHAAWNLTISPGALPERQGWYAVHDASHPHWKRFRFD